MDRGHAKARRARRADDKSPGHQQTETAQEADLRGKARIVDGSDGKTYIAELTQYGAITITQSNMRYQQEAVLNDDPRYAELRKLFD